MVLRLCLMKGRLREMDLPAATMTVCLKSKSMTGKIQTLIRSPVINVHVLSAPTPTAQEYN